MIRKELLNKRSIVRTMLNYDTKTFDSAILTLLDLIVKNDFENEAFSNYDMSVFYDEQTREQIVEAAKLMIEEIELISEFDKKVSRARNARYRLLHNVN